MRARNSCFYGKIRKIITKLSLFPLLIWSPNSANLLVTSNFPSKLTSWLEYCSLGRITTTQQQQSSKMNHKPSIGSPYFPIKGHRPRVPRRLKCQYVKNMSITYMLKKPSEKMANSSTPLRPPLPWPNAAQALVNYLVNFKTRIINNLLTFFEASYTLYQSGILFGLLFRSDWSLSDFINIWRTVRNSIMTLVFSPFSMQKVASCSNFWRLALLNPKISHLDEDDGISS